MRIEIEIDGALPERASELAGITDPSVAVRLAIEEFVARETVRRLMNLGGAETRARPSRRRRARDHEPALER